MVLIISYVYGDDDNHKDEDDVDDDQDVRGSDRSVHKGLFGQNGDSTGPGALPRLSGEDEDGEDDDEDDV